MVWPFQGCGSILITCRSETIAASSTVSYIEVPTFSDEESSAFLLQRVCYTVDPQADMDISREISKRLGSHALAIDLMARHIQANYTSLALFVKSYEKNHQAFHKLPESDMVDTKCNKDLDWAWNIVFNQLSAKSARILGILSMLGPDRIPRSIFDIRDGSTFLKYVDSKE